MDTGKLKHELYGRINTERMEGAIDYPNGWLHLPQVSDEFCRQLVAEHLVSREVKGYRKWEWIKTRERNEALDCSTLGRRPTRSRDPIASVTAIGCG